MARGQWKDFEERTREHNSLPVPPLVAGVLPRAHSDYDGHSLIELVIAMAAGLVVFGAAIQGLSHLRGGFIGQQERATRQQDVRISLAVMASELGAAGIGLQLIGRPLLTVAAAEVSFYANLSGLSTHLTRASEADETVLHVRHSAGWRKGKRIFVCDDTRCLQGRLARHGRRGELALLNRLKAEFPEGSLVMLVNHVRYYLRGEGKGRSRLMRMVDGGASTMVDEVTAMRLSYFGSEGKPALDPAMISQVRIDLTLKGQEAPIRRVVSLTM